MLDFLNSHPRGRTSPVRDRPTLDIILEMRNTYWLPLVVLSAISSLSFLFTRSVSQTLSPIFTADVRALLGGGCVIAYSIATGIRLDWRSNFIPYLVIGCLNFALPFFLYSYAARYLPVAYLAILNATAPMFGAVVSAWFLKEKFAWSGSIGLLFGLAGVAVICETGFRSQAGTDFLKGSLACIAGALSYALAGTYVRRRASGLSATAISGGTQFLAGLLMVPFAAASLPVAPVPVAVIVNLAMLAIVNSAIAYLLYFRLVLAIGATRALTITFLAPAFSACWGFMFFGERVSGRMVAGSLLVLLSVYLVNHQPKPAPTLETNT